MHSRNQIVNIVRGRAYRIDLISIGFITVIERRLVATLALLTVNRLSLEHPRKRFSMLARIKILSL